MVARIAFAALAGVTFSVCGRPHEVEIEQPAHGRAFSTAETAEIQRIGDAAFRDVRSVLDGLPPHITLILRWDKDVMPETGESASAGYPGNLQWMVDPDRDVMAIIRTQLRPAMIHELHHLARASRVHTSTALRDRLVTEGLATAFERDFAHVSPPWGAPPPAEWTSELLALPPGAPADEWFKKRADGRRFVGIRVGTELVDRALQKTGKSAAALVFATTDEVLAAAQ